MKFTKYQISLKSQTKLNLSKFQKKLFFQLSKFLKAPIAFKAKARNDRNVFTVNKSPFIFSRSKEQFEMF